VLETPNSSIKPFLHISKKRTLGNEKKWFVGNPNLFNYFVVGKMFCVEKPIVTLHRGSLGNGEMDL
jgi:hypothetical protein